MEKSDCSRAADRESIHKGIRDSVIFGELRRMVCGVNFSSKFQAFSHNRAGVLGPFPPVEWGHFSLKGKTPPLNWGGGWVEAPPPLWATGVWDACDGPGNV